MGSMTRPTYGDLEEPLRRSVYYARAKRLEREAMSEQTSIVQQKPQQQTLAKVTDDQGVSVDVVVARVEKVREVQKRIMKVDVHYGKVPGTNKDCLLKPGAEILGLTFQLGPDFKAEDRWDGEHLECVVTCTLNHIPSGNPVGSGVGSCSTREKKYAWRNSGRKCPSCGKEGALLKSKDKPEWFCWRKKDGCGATFPEKDERITGQKVGRAPNPDLADNYNTVRKMACKRAHVAAILFATCASEIFTQDLEDGMDDEPPHISPHAYPDEDHNMAPVQSPEYDAVMRELQAIFDEVKKANPVTWDNLVAWRGRIGTRGDKQGFRQRAQATWETVSPDQRQAMSKLQQAVDRQLVRYEGLIQPPSDTNGDDQ